MRRRPIIDNGTLMTANGYILRGCGGFGIRDRGTIANDPEMWKLVRSRRFNFVRLDVKVGARTVSEQLPIVDRAVQLAAENNMYIMILTSEKPGSYNREKLLEFWGKAAARYADKTHVFYELTNEPTMGGPSWGSVSQFTSQVVKDLQSVYNVMRRDAPNTPICVPSSANLHPNPTEVLKLIDRFDFEGPTVWSYHHYHGTMKFGGVDGMDGVAYLRNRFPIIMTETNYWMGENLRNTQFRHVLRHYERLGISWVTLSNPKQIYQEEIMKDLGLIQ